MSHTLQITGLSELESPLEIGKSYDIKITADCNSITKKNTEDGNFEYKYKLQQLTAEITQDNGKVVKVKDIKKQSVKLRQQLCMIALDRGLDPETFYETTMTKFRHYTMEILDLIESLDK